MAYDVEARKVSFIIIIKNLANIRKYIGGQTSNENSCPKLNIRLDSKKSRWIQQIYSKKKFLLKPEHLGQLPRNLAVDLKHLARLRKIWSYPQILTGAII